MERVSPKKEMICIRFKFWPKLWISAGIMDFGLISEFRINLGLSDFFGISEFRIFEVVNPKYPKYKIRNIKT